MRFVPHSPAQISAMLETMGIARLDDLLAPIPEPLRVQEAWDEEGLSEGELFKTYSKLAARNQSRDQMKCYLGGGAYDHHSPAVVEDLSSKPEFLTSYTQYQPESNQGFLQGLFEYQTLMCRLTGMEVSNASHYDGGTSLVEAAMMALRMKPGKLVYSSYLHPHYQKLLKTYLKDFEDALVEVNPAQGILSVEDLPQGPLSAVILQTPNFHGALENIQPIADAVHEVGGLCIVSVYPIALGLIEPPGTQGADIVVGEGQSLGLPLNFGGPYFGFMCTRSKHQRKMPGRLVGLTQDVEGREGYVLTLQTREQHIRREKAVSNICTNQALCALRAGIFLSYLGNEGLRALSATCYQRAHTLYQSLIQLPGVQPLWQAPFFNEFTLELKNVPVEDLLKHLKTQKIFGGISQKSYTGQNAWTVAVTETKDEGDLQDYVSAVKEVLIS